MRAKVTVHLNQAIPQGQADEVLERFARLAMEVLQAQSAGATVDERVLTAELNARREVRRALRRLEVTGLHIVGSGKHAIAARRREP